MLLAPPTLAGLVKLLNLAAVIETDDDGHEVACSVCGRFIDAADALGDLTKAAIEHLERDHLLPGGAISTTPNTMVRAGEEVTVYQCDECEELVPDVLEADRAHGEECSLHCGNVTTE
ncbi:hypothetical protein ACFWYW_46880 [Nonomuraea sp. NPDC059023]|uniref:hypothetical protein n=1 Tax=unclassified Nonomuraea TaxID=2593643 RepID=UPI0036ABC1B4